MKRKDLISQIKRKKSFLCIGLDTDINKIPKFLLDLEDPIFEFNKKIIDAIVTKIGPPKVNETTSANTSALE